MMSRSDTTILTHASSRAALALGLVALSAVLGACGKKAPPPPPPPPPPVTKVVEEPPALSMTTIAQELKADSRVSFASGVTITDEGFARAAVKLADAIARGDAAKLGAMLTRKGKGVLDELTSSGGFTDATKPIEAVRVVFAQAPGGLSDIDRGAALEAIRKENIKELERFRQQLLRGGINEEDVKRVLAARTAELEKATSALSSGEAQGASALGEGKAEMVLLLAVQDPRGSYLLGWAGSKAGEGWLFTNAATTPLTRGRAADWDGVGVLGFSLGIGPATDVPAPAADPKKPGG